MPLRPLLDSTEHVQTGLSCWVLMFLLMFPQVMSAGRSADGREVQIPLQQVAPSLISPLSAAPPSHRPANLWPSSEPTAQQGNEFQKKIFVR